MTRVPKTAHPAAGEVVTVPYQVATSPDFSMDSLAAEGDIDTDGSIDYTVKVIADALAPATRCYYRFYTGTQYHSVVGQTKTAPASDMHPQTVSFAFVSC
jgi:alkaline phosphatase D